MKRLKISRPEQVLRPIREEDFERLKGILREKSDLAEYVKRMCLFRMSVVGHTTEDRMNVEKLSDLIHRVGQDEFGRLPSEFEISRDILLRIREKGDFESILGVRVIA